MTDKEKIKVEIERLKESGCASPIVICDTLLAFIDSMQEKPVSTDILRKASEEYLKVLSETPYNNTPVTNAQTIIKELVSYLDNPSKYNPGYYTENIGENLLDEIHNRWEDDPHTKWPKCPYKDFKNVARHFANWQKQLMMKDAIEVEIIDPGTYTIIKTKDDTVLYGRYGDKVKLLIIKEE